jgi:hypothetical protein
MSPVEDDTKSRAAGPIDNSEPTAYEHSDNKRAIKKLKSNKNFVDAPSQDAHEQLKREVASFENEVNRLLPFKVDPDWGERGGVADTHVHRLYRNICEILKRGPTFEFSWLYVQLMAVVIRWMAARRGDLGIVDHLHEVQGLVKFKRNNYRTDAILYLNPKILSYKGNANTAISEKNCEGSATEHQRLAFRLICGGGRHLHFALQFHPSTRVSQLKEWWIHHQATNSIAGLGQEFMFRFRIDGEVVADDILISHLPPKKDLLRTVEVVPVSMPFAVICLHTAIMIQSEDLCKLFVDLLNPKHRTDCMAIAYYLDALSSRFNLREGSILFGLMPLIDRKVLSKARDLYSFVLECLRKDSGLTHDLVSLIVVGYLNWHSYPIMQLPSEFKCRAQNIATR